MKSLTHAIAATPTSVAGAAARARPAPAVRAHDVVNVLPISIPTPASKSVTSGPLPVPVAARPGHQLSRFAVRPPLPAGVQAKLSISQPDDKYEQEADRVADAVMRMPEPTAVGRPDDDEDKPDIQTKPIAGQITPLLYRQPDIGAESETREKEEEVQGKVLLQRQPGPHDEQQLGSANDIETLHAKRAHVNTTVVPENLEKEILRAQGLGQPLPNNARAFFETRFGHDFSRVRIHTDSRAAHLTSRINAQAFTHGQEIFFAAGRYQPGADGDQLLAHELTHTIQQTAHVGAVLSRLPGTEAETQDDVEVLLDPRTFAQLWSEFNGHRWNGRDSEAVALVPTLLARMSPDDAVEHGGDMALWLVHQNERALAARALDELESGWWIRYVARGGAGVPAWSMGGFGVSAGPAELIAQGELEARADHHAAARQLLSVAHLMTQMMLARLYARQAEDRASAEALGEAGHMILVISQTMLGSDYEDLAAMRTRILNVYPQLVSEARSMGDSERVAMLSVEAQRLTQDITDHYSLADLPELGDFSLPEVEPTATPVRRAGTAHSPAPAASTGTREPVDTGTEEAPAPLAAPSSDRVIEGPPPFNGATALALHGNHYVYVSSERYAVSEVLSRTVAWGRNLFGAMSSIVVMHADEDRVIRYYAAALDEDLTESMPAANPMGGEVEVDVATRIESLPNDYHIMVIHVGNGVGFWPSPGRMSAFEGVTGRESRTGPEATRLPRELIRTHVFAQIDTLMENESENREEIARLLSQLDATAFATLGTEDRFRYLRVLLDAWTYQAQERAVVEIMKSVESQGELRAIIEQLQGAGLWEQLIDDLDNELWSLLIAVGERFGTQQLTMASVYQIMADAGLLQIGTPIPGLSVGPNGPEFTPDVLGEIEEAANSFLRFAESMWDAIVMLVTRPDRIVEGLAQLTKMILVFKLAELGYPPAMMMRAQIMGQIGQQLLNGVKGMAVLGVGPQVIRRIRWAIIWEIASFFIGIGEVRAAMAAMGASARVGAIARFLRLLGLLGRAAEAEEATSAITRLARVLSRSSRVLRTEEEVLVALSRLPEEEATRLGRSLEGVELDEAMTLAQLRAVHPELAQLAESSLQRAEVMHQFALKAGGFSDTVARAFTRLSAEGHATEDMARIVSRIPEGEGGRFAHAISMIPEDVSLVGSRAVESLEAIAQSTTRMQAVERLGFRVFDAAFERTGRNAALTDEYLNALTTIEQNLPAANRASEMRRLVEGVERGDADALFRVEDQIRHTGGAGAGSLRTRLEQATNSWASQFSTGSPRGGNPNATAFQTRYCGPTETHVAGGGAEVWADGLIPEEAMLRDAKLTESPARSPFVDVSPHPIPQFVLDRIRASVDDELTRYARVINDSATPVVGLEIVTNTSVSVPFWERMLRAHGIPGRVVVLPWP